MVTLAHTPQKVSDLQPSLKLIILPGQKHLMAIFYQRPPPENGNIYLEKMPKKHNCSFTRFFFGQVLQNVFKISDLLVFLDTRWCKKLVATNLTGVHFKSIITQCISSFFFLDIVTNIKLFSENSSLAASLLKCRRAFHVTICERKVVKW